MPLVQDSVHRGIDRSATVSIKDEEAGGWSSVITGLTVTSAVQVDGEWYHVASQVLVATDHPIAHPPALLRVPCARSISLFPLYRLNMYTKKPTDKKMRNPYALAGSNASTNDTPPSSARTYAHWVEHWQAVTESFRVRQTLTFTRADRSNAQCATGLTVEATTVVLFHSVEGVRCVRFCRLKNVYIHYLMFHREAKPWDSAENLVKWIAKHCPRFRMSKTAVENWCSEVK